MPSEDQLRVLYDYHFHIIARLMDHAEELTENAYREDPGYGRGSVHDLLIHLLATDRSWRVALETGARSQPLDPDELPDLGSLRKLLAAERGSWERLLAELTEADIEAELQISAGPGRTMTAPRWRLRHHVLLHGLQHLAEIAQLLTGEGQSPGDLDFIYYR